jgi:hypothetical protein
VIKFMQKVSYLLNKDVLITIENDKENPLITVTPKGICLNYK